MKKGQNTWIDELVNSIGKFVSIETHDGVFREGKITGFSMRKMIFNEVELDIPTDIELNGDQNDRVTLDRVKIISISL